MGWDDRRTIQTKKADEALKDESDLKDRERVMLPKLKFHGKPMTKEQSEIFLKLMLAKPKEIPIENDEELNTSFLSQIIIKRIKAYKLPYSLSNLFLLMSLSCGVNTPGKAMIILALSFQYYNKNPKSLLTIEDWANIFPFGMPSEKEFDQMWDSQKKSDEPLGNMVDNPENWI